MNPLLLKVLVDSLLAEIKVREERKREEEEARKWWTVAAPPSARDELEVYEDILQIPRTRATKPPEELISSGYRRSAEAIWNMFRPEKWVFPGTKRPMFPKD